VAPTYLSWGRPTGTAIIFSDGDRLRKALVGTGEIDDIDPLDGVTYRDVVYHPSGLAIAFVIDGPEGSAIWMASNTGVTPRRLVWSKTGTVFGSLAFDEGGDQLFYSAHPKDGTPMVAKLLLKEGSVEEGLWLGEPSTDISRVTLAPAVGLPDELGTEPPHAAAIDVGSGCADREAVLTSLTQDGGVTLVPKAGEPTSALGWVDPSRILVAEGGCEGPFDLWITQGAGVTPVLLAAGVDRAAVRTLAPTLPPPLPDLGINTEFA
jgi:hypothetical protein